MIEALTDLSTYPHWNDLVTDAVSAEPLPSDEGPAWFATLQLQLGPVSRSKDFRFVRDLLETDHGDATIRFVGSEPDAKTASPFFLGVEVDPVASSCSVVFSFAYTGMFLFPVVGPLLHRSLSGASTQLPEYLDRQ